MDWLFSDGIYLLLFFVAVLAGFIDSIAGGGGLITFLPCSLREYHPYKRWQQISFNQWAVLFQPHSILFVVASLI